jgi:hypothetical protein
VQVDILLECRSNVPEPSSKVLKPPSLSLSLNVTNFENPGMSGGATDKRKTVSPNAERLTTMEQRYEKESETAGNK